MPAFDCKPVEMFSAGKGGVGHYSEDRVVLGEGILGIIDGSRNSDGLTPPQFAKLLDQCASWIASHEAQELAIDFFAELTVLVSKLKAELGAFDRRSSGAFVGCFFVPARGEVWRVGDCVFAIDGKVEKHTSLVEFISSNYRACIVSSLENKRQEMFDYAVGKHSDDLLEKFLQSQTHFMNHEISRFGFGAVNGEHIPDKFVEVFPVPESAKDIIIASDGYSELGAKLAETEAIRQQQLAADPFCIDTLMGPKGQKPGNESFDDRSFLRLRIMGLSTDF
ncbi:MAG: hypothetical protein AAGI28_12430 [Pseudomonadota bacterium]